MEVLEIEKLLSEQKLVDRHGNRRPAFNKTCRGGAFDFSGYDPGVPADIIEFHDEGSIFVFYDVFDDHAARDVAASGQFYEQTLAAVFFDFVFGLFVGVELQQIGPPPLVLKVVIRTLHDDIKYGFGFAQIHL